MNLTTTLTNLAHLLHHQQQELTHYPPTTHTTPTHKNHQPQPPTNITQLHNKITAEDEINDALNQLLPPTHRPTHWHTLTTTQKCAWAATHTHHLNTTNPDPINTLNHWEHHLHTHYNPPHTHPQHWLTIQQTQHRAKQQGLTITKNQIHKAAQRKKIRTTTYDGARHYYWPDIQRIINKAK